MATPSGSSDNPLIKLTPSSTLIFQLERGSPPKVILKVANATNSKVLFKVKTTQPSWYYVRPNQQILNANQSEEVAIIMVDTECNRYLDQVAIRAEEKLDKHRFLVQSRIIEESDYNRILALPSSQRSDELSKLWDVSKDDRKSIKLKVDFILPTESNITATSNAGAATSSSPKNDQTRTKTISENVETVRSKLAFYNDSSSNTTTKDESYNNPEVIFAELQGLRKKYDAVVEYTVHLTAERDAIVSQLELSQRDLIKEKNKKKTDTNNSSTGNAKDKNADKRIAEKGGFSLSVVIFVALICFFLGRYMS